MKRISINVESSTLPYFVLLDIVWNAYDESVQGLFPPLVLGIDQDLYWYHRNICQQMLYLSFFYFSSAVVIAFAMILWPPEMYHSEDIRQKVFMKTVCHSFQCIFIMILSSKKVGKAFKWT